MIFFLSLLAVVLIDQVSKFAAEAVGLAVHLNQGVSLNLIQRQPMAVVMLLTLSTMLLLGVSLYSFWIKHPVAAGLFFGGAISNLVDRLIFGGVRDWLPLLIVPVSNNLADYFVVISLVFVVILQFKEGVNNGSSA